MSAQANNKTTMSILGGVVAFVIIALLAVFLMRPAPEPDSPVVKAPDPPRTLVKTDNDRPLVKATETKPRPTPAPAVVIGKTELAVVVLDGGSKQPLDNARVEVLRGEEVLHDTRTDKTGTALVEEPAPGDYMLRVRWANAAPMQSGPVTVVADQRTTHMVDYAPRERFRFRLVDTEGNGMPGVKLNIRFPVIEDRNILDPHVENYVTDNMGYFDILNYTDRAGRLVIEAEGGVLMRRRGETKWLNPYTYMPRLNATDYPDPVLEGTREVVMATGRLVDPPKLAPGQSWQVDATSGGNKQQSIPVEGDTFTLRGVPGQLYNIEVYRPGEGAPPPTDRSSMAAFQRLMSRNREVTRQVEFPATAGPFSFEIEFDERLAVKGIVKDENGGPVEGVSVRARGFVDPKGDPPGGVRVGAGNFDTSSPASGADGRFEIQLAEAKEYTFLPSNMDPTKELKGVNSVTIPWERLAAGEEVVLEMRNPSLAWGEVVDEMGNPVAKASVRLRGAELPPGYGRFATPTDDDGLFQLDLPTIPGLDPGRSTADTGSMYIEATKRGYGRGIGPLVVDSPDNPVRIVLYKDVQVMINATKDGKPVDQLNISHVYDVPEFAAPFYAERTETLDGNAGQYLLFNVSRQITTLALSIPGEENAGIVREFRIPLETEMRHEINVDFGDKE